MRDELATILRLVSDGTLSPEEAAPIIEALTRAPGGGTTDGGQPSGRPETGSPASDTGAPAGPAASGSDTAVRERGGRQMRIRVVERGRQVVNLRVPLAFAETALRMVPGISDAQGTQIREAITAHMTGPIVDVEDEDGDGVLISVE